jgi:hypothetical protein
MRQTPATQDGSAKRMNTPCGTTTDVTMEGFLISKGCGKEEAGGADMGIGGHTGGAKKNGAEEAPFVFIGMKGKVMVRGGSGKRKRERRGERDVDHMIPGLHRLIVRHIIRNLDGRRDERDMRHMRWLRHGGHSTKYLYHSSIFTLGEADDRTSLWKGVPPTRP